MMDLKPTSKSIISRTSHGIRCINNISGRTSLSYWQSGERTIPFFIPPGTQAFKRDVPNADVRFLDAGHFALETNVEDITSAILEMNIYA
jgi:hypothetical protein